MKLKIKNLDKSWIRFILNKDIVGITLMPFGIYIRSVYYNEYKFSLSGTKGISLIQHEIIHAKQQTEMLYIFFYIWYLLEYIIRFIYFFFIYLFRKTSFIASILNAIECAYYNLLFEKEAYSNQTNIIYINNRKPFNWINYGKSRRFKQN